MIIRKAGKGASAPCPPSIPVAIFNGGHACALPATSSPVGERKRERRAPIKHTTAWARVTEFVARTASSHLDSSLRLAAQEDHEIRAFAGLGAQRLVRDDKGRARRYPGNTIQHVLRNGDSIERALCTARVRRHRLNVAGMVPARPALWLDRAAVR